MTPCGPTSGLVTVIRLGTSTWTFFGPPISPQPPTRASPLTRAAHRSTRRAAAPRAAGAGGRRPHVSPDLLTSTSPPPCAIGGDRTALRRIRIQETCRPAIRPPGRRPLPCLHHRPLLRLPGCSEHDFVPRRYRRPPGPPARRLLPGRALLRRGLLGTAGRPGVLLRSDRPRRRGNAYRLGLRAGLRLGRRLAEPAADGRDRRRGLAWRHRGKAGLRQAKAGGGVVGWADMPAPRVEHPLGEPRMATGGEDE